jgi:hypothetical protein
VIISKDWSVEDVQNLTKAIKKFPQGTGKRWAVIADFIGKGQKETITKAKEIHAK